MIILKRLLDGIIHLLASLSVLCAVVLVCQNKYVQGLFNVNHSRSSTENYNMEISEIEPVLSNRKETTVDTNNNTNSEKTVDNNSKKVISNANKKEDKYVAKINDAKYTDLQEAINESKDDDVIVILKNIELEDTLNIEPEKKIILDLNNMKITSTSLKTIENKGTLTIKSNGYISNIAGTVVYNSGNLKIENGVLSIIYEGAKIVDNAGNFEFCGGVISALGKDSYGVFNEDNSTFVMQANDNNIPEIVVYDEGSCGVFNSKKIKECTIKEAYITVEGSKIEDYELIKYTIEFAEEFEKFKSSYGIYNEADIDVYVEDAVIVVNRLKSVGIQNNSKGNVILGKNDNDVDCARPIIYAMQDDTSAVEIDLSEKDNGKIVFFDGRVVGRVPIKNKLKSELNNFYVHEDKNGRIVTTILNEIEELVVSEDGNSLDEEVIFK